MRRIDRYLLVQLLTVFAFFTLVLVAVYWVNRAARLFDAVVGDGQGLGVFLELSALTLPNVIRVVLPLSAFAAAVHVAIRLTRDNELVVMQAAGLSFARLLRPVAAFGLCAALMLAVLMHVLGPMARGQLAERQAEIAGNIGAQLLRAGEFLTPADGIVVFIREITQDGALVDLFLSDARAEGERVEYNAARAVLVPREGGPILVMRDGVALIHDTASARLTTISFDELTFDMSALVSTGPPGTDVRALPTPELLQGATALAGVGPAELRHELAERVAQPLLAMLAALIGFAALFLGQYSRLGAWRQVLAAIVVLAVVQLVGNAAAGAALADPALAALAFLPVGVGAGAVALMLWWASRRRRGRAP